MRAKKTQGEINMDPTIIKMIKELGFPIVAAFGMGYFIYTVWKWVTTEVKPVLSEANKTLIALIDRVRMLDNDMIRLTQKLNMILDQQDKDKSKKD
jgi:hypothetical protein